MQRRGFLQAFAGVAAGLMGSGAVASQLASVKPPAEPLLDIPLAPPTAVGGFSAGEGSPQATLIEMLKECRAIRKSELVTTYGSRLVKVNYVHKPDSPRSELDDEVDAVVASMTPRSASVTTGLANVDPFDADALLYGYGFMEEVCEIEVEWIG